MIDIVQFIVAKFVIGELKYEKNIIIAGKPTKCLTGKSVPVRIG